MNRDRILELAGMKKAVGTTEVFMLNEGDDARSYVRGLEIYKELMKDTRAKPAALKAATQFVKDAGDGKLSPGAKKQIANQLSDIASDENPRGAMMSKDDEKEKGSSESEDSAPKKDKLEKKAEATKARKEKAATPNAGRRPPSEGRAAAQKWLRSHPNATAKEFVAVATKAGMAANTARSMFYKLKKKRTTECFIIQKGDQVLSERSRPLIPHFIDQDDFNSEYHVFESAKAAEAARGNFLLHVSEKMEIVELSDEIT